MLNDNIWQNLKDKIETTYNQVDDFGGGSLTIITETVRRFNQMQAPQAAAGMAYYALFSLFPLLLTLIAVGSFVLESQQVQQQLLELVTETIPVSQALIGQNIQQVLDLRGPVGIVGLIGLLWSATGVFNTLAYNINRAWEKEERNFLERRLVALGIVGGLAILLFLSIISTAVFDLLSQFWVRLAQDISLLGISLWGFLSNVLPTFFRLILFLGLYRWVPNTEVKWLEAFWGAMAAATGWELITIGFTWYLGSGFVQYELVYGSLGTIIGLMFWIYLGSLVSLFGAHLAAAVAKKKRQE